MSTYSHTQKGYLQTVLLIAAVFCAVGAWAGRSEPLISVIMAGMVAVFFVLSWAFAWLVVRDEEDCLAVRFGPLPWFKKLIPYAEMTGAEPCRSSFLDGWGIHWSRRGWLWNIRGYDGVEIVTRKGSTLIGTDDPQGLLTFLKTKIPAGGR